MDSDADQQEGGYDPIEVEERWRARWASERVWEVDLETIDPKARFYNLTEFPYPSAEGLHVGHVYTYCGADVYARYMRMRGRQVFQPMGFDSFGIHTENFALKAGEHPLTLTARTVANYRRQLDRIGAGWAWENSVTTSDPAYYRWTQWIFVQLFKAGLAYQAEAPVTWCPSCLTVLANEQLEGDRCERCSTVVTQRVMRQWFLRITRYAAELDLGLEALDWPAVSKRLQGAWIGRSDGVEVDFPVVGSSDVVKAFTTRVDTIFGATFVALSASHPLAVQTTGGAPGPTGLAVINPADQSELPVFCAPYVLGEYGTGAVMGVPAHDPRDFEFAKQHSLAVRSVVSSAAHHESSEPWIGEGVLLDSGPYSGLDTVEARDRIASWLEAQGRGRREVRYRLRDWLISRQRYWGPPIPIVHCPKCGPVAVPEQDLPVVLPYIADFRPTGSGRSPLASDDAFVETTCPECGAAAQRETDVSDAFLDSSWYFLRYPSSDIGDRPWDADRTTRLLPVDLYAGGREHVMRHHLYARFVTMALNDLGHVPFREPFPRLRLHGLLIKDGAKMSKSRGNVVNPDDYVDRVGADCLRLYLLFCGAWEDGGDFSDRGLNGVVRFTRRVHRMVTEPGPPAGVGTDLSFLGAAVARVESSISRFKFNTAIAALMNLQATMAERRSDMTADQWAKCVRTLILLLAPLAPHLAEELWSLEGGEFSVHFREWPAEATPTKTSTVVVVQVNGKARDLVEVPFDAQENLVVAAARESPGARRHLGDSTPTRVVYQRNRVVNFVLD